MADLKANKKQRIVSMILSFVIVITMFPLMPTSSVNAEEIPIDNFIYTINNDDHTATLVGTTLSTSFSGEITIPREISYNNQTYTVTSIGENAFKHYTFLRGVTIPDGVKSIEKSAFSECYGLVKVTLGENSELTSIGSSAFYSCKLFSINIPAGVTSIENGVFAYSGIREITIPMGVKSIGGGAFQGCEFLHTVTFEGRSPIIKIEKNTFNGCIRLKNITIPTGVTSIAQSTFNGCSALTGIEIPANVTSIGNSAFSGCTSLETVTFEEKVYTFETIRESAFKDCSALTSINIPDTATGIGDSAF